MVPCQNENGRLFLDVNGHRRLDSLAAGQRRSSSGGSVTYWSWVILSGLTERGNCSRGSHSPSMFLRLLLPIKTCLLPTSFGDPKRPFTVLHTKNAEYVHCFYEMENSSHEPEVAAVQLFAGETVAIGVIIGAAYEDFCNNLFFFVLFWVFSCLLTDKIVATNVVRPCVLFSVEN